MVLKAADLIKVNDETSAIIANTGNKIVALNVKLIPVFIPIVVEKNLIFFAVMVWSVYFQMKLFFKKMKEISISSHVISYSEC